MANKKKMQKGMEENGGKRGHKWSSNLSVHLQCVCPLFHSRGACAHRQLLLSIRSQYLAVHLQLAARIQLCFDLHEAQVQGLSDLHWMEAQQRL